MQYTQFIYTSMETKEKDVSLSEDIGIPKIEIMAVFGWIAVTGTVEIQSQTYMQTKMESLFLITMIR